MQVSHLLIKKICTHVLAQTRVLPCAAAIPVDVVQLAAMLQQWIHLDCTAVCMTLCLQSIAAHSVSFQNVDYQWLTLFIIATCLIPYSVVLIRADRDDLKKPLHDETDGTAL